MAENGSKSVTFPATNVAGEAKLKRLLDTIGEYMGAKIAIESVVVIQASFPSDRPDIESICKRLAGIKTGLRPMVQTQAQIETKKEKAPAPPIPPTSPREEV